VAVPTAASLGQRITVTAQFLEVPRQRLANAGFGLLDGALTSRFGLSAYLERHRHGYCPAPQDDPRDGDGIPRIELLLPDGPRSPT